MRQRFTQWLCVPLQRQINHLAVELGRAEAELRQVKPFCEALAADLAKLQAEVNAVKAEDRERQPRVRVARRFSEFANAATAASAKRSN